MPTNVLHKLQPLVNLFVYSLFHFHRFYCHGLKMDLLFSDWIQLKVKETILKQMIYLDTLFCSENGLALDLKSPSSLVLYISAYCLQSTSKQNVQIDLILFLVSNSSNVKSIIYGYISKFVLSFLEEKALSCLCYLPYVFCFLVSIYLLL